VAERVDVVVVGAGVGGLGVAARLAAAGRRVVVCERRLVTGGKLATLDRDGFRFDLGPSLLTLPDLLGDLFRAVGATLSDHVDLVRLDPQFRYHWADGSSLVVPDGAGATAVAFEVFSPGAGAEWRRFDARGRRADGTSTGVSRTVARPSSRRAAEDRSAARRVPGYEESPRDLGIDVPEFIPN